MASDQDLIIKITAETDKAVKEIKKLTTEVKKFAKIDDKNSKNISKNSKTINTGFNKLGVSMSGLVTGAAALGIAMKAIEFGNLAAEAEQSADAFERIYTEMGLNVIEEFDKIKEASKGLIPDSSIKQAAVTAVSLGVPIEKLAELMEVARVKAREMGTTAESAFMDLAVGIGRGSPMILDNLGLTIKLGDANSKMAKELGKTVEQLTKQEKQMALTNEVIEAGAVSIERYGDASLTAKENSQKFDAAIKGVKEKIGGSVLPAMDALTVATTTFINAFILDDVNEELDKLKDKMKEVTGEVKEEAKQTPKELKDALDFTFGAVFDGANVIEEVDAITGEKRELVFYPTAKFNEADVEQAKLDLKNALGGEDIEANIMTKLDKNSTKNMIQVLDAKTKEIVKSVSLDVPATVTFDELVADKTVKGVIKNMEDAAQLTVQLNPNAKLTEDALSGLRELKTPTTIEFKPEEEEVLKSAEYWENKTITVPVVFVPQNAPGGSAPTGSVADTLVDEVNREGGF